MSKLAHFLLGLRPAPLASAVAAVCGLNRRRLVRADHGTFLINPISDFGSAILKGEYEPQMRSVLSRYLSPGGVFIDLGANEGYFSVLASHLVGPKGTVIAIEPQSRLQNVFQTNLAVNECYNVRLIRCAVCDRTGTAQLSLAPSTNTGASSLFRSTRYALPTEEIRSLCLGDLLDRTGVEHCDLMKVDIEGAEYDVFMAAADVLKKGVLKNIALEIHSSILESRGLSADELHKYIVENGYELNSELGPWVYSFGG